MTYAVIKALHIIFMVTWFAGLFYIVRLFIYHREAAEKKADEQEILTAQFRIMERRLWFAITWPSAVLCTVFGVMMLYKVPSFLLQGFMHVKLAFVAFLWTYQVYVHSIFNRFRRSDEVLNSIKLRFLNEVPTVILIAVVFLIIQRDALDWIIGVTSVIGIAVLLTLAIKWYQRLRRK